jgi:UDP-glucose 4-epimerase
LNVLVTGATGFIGSHICRLLVEEKNYKVFGLSRSGNKKNLKYLSNWKNFKVVAGDIMDESGLKKLIEGNSIETVLHVAAFIPDVEAHKSCKECIEVNAVGTLSVLNAARSSGVKNFVYSSTMGVYSAPPKYVPVDEKHPTEPSTVYGMSKLFGEKLCEYYSERDPKKMNVAILRYSGVYGPGQKTDKAIPKFIDAALKGGPLELFSKGRQSSDFVFVGDVAKANVLAIGKSGTYNIGSGRETTVKELAEKIITLCESKSKILYSGTESVRPFRFSYNTDKAKKELGFKPQSLEKGLQEFIKYMKSENIEYERRGW